MALPLKVQNAGRYSEIFALLVKYSSADIVRDVDLRAAGLDGWEDRKESGDSGKPQELAHDLEAMGPVFIKLGQLLSTRSDMLPPAYLEALSRLQDDVAPFSFGEVEKTIQAELGGRMSKLFSDFDAEPLAAASLGQVHAATLRNGQAVAVKVQRPEVRTKVIEDLDALSELAAFLDQHSASAKKYDFVTIIEELRRSLLRELDYLQEANNLRILKENLREFRTIIVPEPVDDYTTGRVLTMSFIAGKKLTAVSNVRWTEIDGHALADELFRAYLQQLLVDGFFHADPHPGNVYLTDDGKLGLLDLGMVSRMPAPLQQSLVKLLLAISEGRGDDAAEIAREMGEEPREGFDRFEFHRRVADLVHEHEIATLGRLNMGQIIMQIRVIAADTGIRVPPALNMLGKALMNLDKVGQTLSPGFDPNRSIRENATKILHQRLRKNLSLGSLYHGALDINELVQRMPSRFNKILENVADNNVRIRVDSIDEAKLLAGMQKIANRITLGLVLAALIVGAALLMRVPSSSTLLGYPALAMLCFTAAVAGAVALIAIILLHDEPAPKPRTREEVSRTRS